MSLFQIYSQKTEQFENFLQEFPMSTNFYQMISSIKKICEFLLSILENKILQLEIKAEHLCWNMNGEIILGFEVFKYMTKSQSQKPSKFMQIETSKKFCSQILQALKEVSVVISYFKELFQNQLSIFIGVNDEVKNDLNRFIEQQELLEENCTLQQFLKNPIFQE